MKDIGELCRTGEFLVIFLQLLCKPDIYFKKIDLKKAKANSLIYFPVIKNETIAKMVVFCLISGSAL